MALYILACKQAVQLVTAPSSAHRLVIKRMCVYAQELQEKLDLQHRDRKRAIAKLNRVSSPTAPCCFTVRQAFRAVDHDGRCSAFCPAGAAFQDSCERCLLRLEEDSEGEP